MASVVRAGAHRRSPVISDYFESPWALARMRSGSVGAHIDGFAAALAEAGYSPHTIRGYIRAAVHLGRWADSRRLALAAFDEESVRRFARHLTQCRCGRLNKGVFGDAVSGAERLLARLGEDPSRYDAAGLRLFVIEHLGKHGRGQARATVRALRAFLRFLVAEGRLVPGVEHCVPTVPQWRLSSLPRFLEAPDVERVVNSCDTKTVRGLRDHAVLLLLARLGLRASDVVQMSLGDIDWRRGTLRVRGKGRREALLPLSQEVGDAVLTYLERGRPSSRSDKLFLTIYAPTRPFATSATVSDIVRVALKRAGIGTPPNFGAHLLRHSAATAMLRAGGTLGTIATVLRHQSADTTAHYAKVDVLMLQQVSQPWLGDTSC
jgi:integrase/recombinase XerD